MEENMPQNTGKNQSAALWIILAVVVLAAAALFMYFGDYGSDKETNSNSSTIVNTNSEVNTNTQNTNTSEIDTSDWKTYENTKYGYSFMYPGDWFFYSPIEANADPELGGVHFGDPEQLTGELWVEEYMPKDCTTLVDCATRANSLANINGSELITTKLGSQDAYKTLSIDEAYVKETIYFMASKSMIRIEYLIKNDSRNTSVFNLLIENFKIKN